MSIGVIVGSAFQLSMLEGMDIEPVQIKSDWGEWSLYHVRHGDRSAYVSFRHGHPHALLPNQIPYRAQAAAFREVDCGALLITSSVGVLDAELPLYKPMLVGDLITLDNRLPDGSACTMFTEPSDNHGHLVLSEGMFSPALTNQVATFLDPEARDLRVVFGYVGGPRTKTRAENLMWHHLGAQVNSMTLGPEVVLANELGISCCGAVVGHKYSLPTIDAPAFEGIAESLVSSREALGRLVRQFIEEATPVVNGNHLYRYKE